MSDYSMTESEKKIMDDYHAQMKEYHDDCDRHNDRLLKAIKSVKGDRFYKMVLEEIEESEGIRGKARLTDKPKGNRQRPNVWVNQTTNGGYSGDSFAGTVSIKLKPKMYIEYDYEM